MNKSSKIIISLGVVAIAAVVGLAFWQNKAEKKENANPGQYDAFAQCFAQKNITMYGAEWCTHCQAQKKLFGDSFKYVPYIECPENTKLCLDKGIEGYPTWILQNGEKLVGEQTLEKLSQETSCAL